jgi:hypothetical protein
MTFLGLVFSRAAVSMRGAAAIAGAMLITGSFATAARATEGGWSVVSSPNPSAPNGQLNAVSCAAASECVAVGGDVRSSGVGVTLAERWDGSTWQVQPTPNPTSARVSILYGVSCTAPSSCMAVGRYLNSSGTYVTLSERWDGTRWSVVPTPNPAGAAGSILDGVACTSPSRCIAVGSPTDSQGATGTLAELWDGTRWRILPTPAIATGFVNSVACTSASACTAVGFTGSQTLAMRWNGTDWSVQPTPNPSSARDSGLNGVACSSTTDCTASGNYFTSSGVGLTLAERWNGTRWSIEPTVNPAGASLSVLAAIACTSASACTAVGFTGSQTLAESWNGNEWSLQPTPDPSEAQASDLLGVACASASACTAVGDRGPSTLAEGRTGSEWRIQPTSNPVGAHSSVLNAVACTSSSACTAVGNQADLFGNPVGTVAERWNGSEWRIQATPNPEGTYGSLLTGVACASAAGCMAVGGSTDSSGVSTATLAERWNGARWTIVPTPNRATSPGSFLAAVSCSALSACMAVGASTDSSGVSTGTLAERWDGTQWRIQATPDPQTAGGFLDGVSCTAAKACIAVGFLTASNGSPNGTFAEGWNDKQWTLLPTPNPAGAPQSALNGVSCSSPSACIAVGSAADSSGNPLGTLAERWNGTDWTILATPNPDGVQNSFLASVACPSASVCTAAGLVFPGTGPQLAAERWNGTTWELQTTPQPPAAYDIDVPAVACPSLSSCTAVGGYTNNGPKLTLTERWSPTEQTTQATAATTQATGGLGSFCLRPLHVQPTPHATLDPTTAPNRILARPARCQPM